MQFLDMFVGGIPREYTVSKLLLNANLVAQIN